MPTIVTADFETHYSREFSLTKLTTEAYVRSPEFETIGLSLKFDDAPAVWYPKPQVAEVLQSIDWSDKFILCQNTAFDAAIFRWHYNVQPKAWMDTLGMSRALFPHEKSHSLAEQAKRAGIGAKGDEVVNALGLRYADFGTEALERYGEYCKNDTELTYKLFTKYMEAGFPRQELQLIDLTLRMFVDPVLVLDKPLLQAHYDEVVERKAALLDKVRDMMLADGDPDYVHAVYTEGAAGIKKLLMSNDKFADVLRRFNVEPPMKRSPTTGKMTLAFAKTDEGFKSLEEHPDPDVQGLVAARLGNKTTLEETRTQRFIGMAGRGPMPIPLRYYGAHSGRWSGQDSVNLQNLPARGANAGKIKRAIKAPPGHVVIDCDSAQIEARTLAWLAGQHDLVEAFAKKQDVYKIMASSIYGIPVEEVTPPQRQVGKTVILGCFGPDTLVLTNRGWLPIVRVQATDTVWDGEEWVCHQGVVPQGEKEVLTALGISATSDHEILTAHGWAEWSEVLANLSLLAPAMSLANSLALAGNAVLMDPSGKVSSTISPRCAAPVGGKALLRELIFGPDARPGATTAPKRSQRLRAWLGQGLRRCAKMLHTGIDYLLASAPLSSDAQTRTIPCTPTMGGVGLQFIQSGLRTALSSCATLLDSMAGICLPCSSTESTTTKGTNRATYGSSHEASICRTNARSKRVMSKGSSWSCDALKQRMQTYDIAYAGPRNSYTVLTSEGPLIVHNCGYGVGHKKLRAFLKMQAKVEVSEEEAKRIVDKYRSTYPNIPLLWKQGDAALRALAMGNAMRVDVPGVINAVPGKGLTLPSGLFIQYPDLARVIVKNPEGEEKNQWRYMSKGAPVYIYGGKCVENFCQAVARCVVAEQMLRIAKRYKVVLTVHDAVAIIAKESESKEAQAYVEECMSWNPKWATGLPLACESGVGYSYGEC